MELALPRLGNEETTLETNRALDAFLASVERRAFRIAQVVTRNRDDALDVVQDAMLGLATRYADRPPEEWPPLFHRILQSRIRDWYRRRAVRDRFRVFLRPFDDAADASDPINELPDPNPRPPEAAMANARAGAAIERAVANLPLRQQQAFLLRVWEGLDVAQTAYAMKCSEGSVKTHLSRAVDSLRARLEDHEP